MTTYITVAIPYVNAAPHLGYAFELIEADLAARARRALGEPVRFLGGTDEHSLKNVLAAEASGESTQRFVDRHADRFAALAEPLDITFDDFVRTSRDPRHRPAVERLWHACAARGDLSRRDYSGQYCVGCEQFYDEDDHLDRRCPEHGTVLETVTETNWFFRLSSYTERLIELIESEQLAITPAPFRAEILAVLRGGLNDISVSRSVERAHGWGIPVPGDPTQVIYVWFDALANYLSALDYGTAGGLYERWWRNSDERIHVIGKGITRFHAIYWPAFLLSAGERLPTRVQVHPYLSVDGAKISKSAGSQVSPTALVEQYGSDALRWWIVSDVAAVADTDFTEDRLVRKANEALANGLGNAVNRIATLRHRCRAELAEVSRPAEPMALALDLERTVASALADFDRRGAAEVVTEVVEHVNQFIEATAPWKLAGTAGDAEQLVVVLDTCAATLRRLALAIEPITPDVARRAIAVLDGDPSTVPALVATRLVPT